MIKRLQRPTAGDAAPAAGKRLGRGRRKRRQAEEEPVEDDESDESDESEEEGEGSGPVEYPSVVRRTTHKKKKVMVLCSRGVTSTFVELMEDVLKLLPHSRKDPKFDKKEALTDIVEIAQLAGCHLAMYFEARKMSDLYLWAGRVDGGPSAKFLVEQIRPMRDLRLTGNCLLGSRPILSFDKAFAGAAHLKVLQTLLGQLFAPPKGHPRSKPFHDHVLAFSLLGGRVIVRHYQLVPPRDKKDKADGPSLVEIGPRLALVPIRVLAGCFHGATLFANEAYVSPNMARADLKRQASRSTIGGVAQKEKRRKRIAEGGDEVPEDELADVFS